MSLIEIQNLSYTLPRGRELFRDLNLQLASGEALHIYGANGTGKSTLVSLLLGRIKPTKGRVRRFSTRLGYLPQLQNLEFHLPLKLIDVLNTLSDSFTEDRALKLGLLSRSQFELLWNTASGGERQRTLLTALLLEEPELLVLDEPLNHLDAVTREAVVQALGRYIGGKEGRALVLVSHLSVHEIQRFGIRLVSLPLGNEK